VLPVNKPQRLELVRETLFFS
jgi:hypothetical protein